MSKWPWDVPTDQYDQLRADLERVRGERDRLRFLLITSYPDGMTPQQIEDVHQVVLYPGDLTNE